MRLFCYGTLTFPGIMYGVTGARFRDVDAVLEGYACYALRGHPFPGMVPEWGATTAGVVYTGLAERHLRRLDAYEGDLYMRARVRALDHAGRPLQAWTYLLAPARQALLSGSHWRREAFEQEYLQRYLRTCPAGA